MKSTPTTIGKLKNGTEFWLSTRRMRRVVWILQNKKKGKASIISNSSGIKKVMELNSVCYI
jgi:hypothetical protein